MEKKISVSKAIRRGHLIVTLPLILIMLGVGGIFYYADVKKILPGWAIAIGIVLAFSLPWLWWSVIITKWRIWAFDNVDDLHELKRRAIEQQLIWPDGSIFEKTEIRSTTEKEKLTRIQKELDRPEVFRDDPAIPPETLIHFSKADIYFVSGLSLVFLVLGIYLYTSGRQQVIGAAAIALSVYLGITRYRRWANKVPQIIIGNTGIGSATFFHEWRHVHNEAVIVEGIGKYSKNYLVYDHPGGHVRTKIEELETDRYALRHLLKTYRGRYEQQRRTRH